MYASLLLLLSPVIPKNPKQTNQNNPPPPPKKRTKNKLSIKSRRAGEKIAFHSCRRPLASGKVASLYFLEKALHKVPTILSLIYENSNKPRFLVWADKESELCWPTKPLPKLVMSCHVYAVFLKRIVETGQVEKRKEEVKGLKTICNR